MLHDIVVFGTACMVYVNVRNESLEERDKPAIIIGKSEETRGCKVYTLKNKMAEVTQHFCSSKPLEWDAQILLGEGRPSGSDTQ